MDSQKLKSSAGSEAKDKAHAGAEASAGAGIGGSCWSRWKWRSSPSRRNCPWGDKERHKAFKESTSQNVDPVVCKEQQFKSMEDAFFAVDQFSEAVERNCKFVDTLVDELMPETVAAQHLDEAQMYTWKDLPMDRRMLGSDSVVADTQTGDTPVVIDVPEGFSNSTIRPNSDALAKLFCLSVSCGTQGNGSCVTTTNMKLPLELGSLSCSCDSGQPPYGVPSTPGRTIQQQAQPQRNSYDLKLDLALASEEQLLAMEVCQQRLAKLEAMKRTCDGKPDLLAEIADETEDILTEIQMLELDMLFSQHNISEDT